MRYPIAIFTFFLLTACATSKRELYQSVGSGPRAEIALVSPYLKDKGDTVTLFTYQSYLDGEECKFNGTGDIDLSSAEQPDYKFIRAGVRGHYAVFHFHAEFLGPTVSRDNGFSFIPEVGNKYLVEHIDNPAQMRLKFYAIDAAGTKEEIQVQKYEVCDWPE